MTQSSSSSLCEYGTASPGAGDPGGEEPIQCKGPIQYIDPDQVYISTAGARDLLDIVYHLPFSDRTIRRFMYEGRLEIVKTENWGKYARRLYTTPAAVRQFASWYKNRHSKVVRDVVLDLMDLGFERVG